MDTAAVPTEEQRKEEARLAQEKIRRAAFKAERKDRRRVMRANTKRHGHKLGRIRGEATKCKRCGLRFGLILRDRCAKAVR